MRFVIQRKLNFGPNIECSAAFDPTDPLCSPGVIGATYEHGTWGIDLENFDAVQALANLYGAITPVFRPHSKPSLVILDQEVPSIRSRY
jgi:hypothetical protein